MNLSNALKYKVLNYRPGMGVVLVSNGTPASAKRSPFFVLEERQK